MKISAINFNNVKQCQKNLENQKADISVGNNANRENYVSLWNKGGYRMSFGSTLNLSSDFNKWIKEKKKKKKTLDAYDFCVKNIKKNDPETYNSVKDLKPQESSTSFHIITSKDGKKQYDVSHKLNLYDKEDSYLGYYQLIFDLNGKSVDEVLDLM